MTSMAFFRTVSFSEQLPAIAGDGVTLRAPQMGDYLRMGDAARGEPRLPGAVGADMAGRRSHARVLSPAHQALFRGPARRSRLSVLYFPQARQCPRRRPHARQCAARLRAGRQPRLLDGRELCPPGLHDRGGTRHDSVRLRYAAAAPDRGRLHSGEIWPRSGSSRRPDFSARDLPANICASTASGRTTCSMPASRTTLNQSCARLDQGARERLGVATVPLL